MPRVFLSYAREDIKHVRKIRDFLQRSGVDTWWDKDDILPGQRWQALMETELASSDFVAGCFSIRSVNKRGYVQQELKLAREFGKKMLDNDIYFIPILLEECELPASIASYHAVNFFSPDGPRLLLEAIETGSKQRELVAPRSTSEPKTEGVDLSGLGTSGWLKRLFRR